MMKINDICPSCEKVAPLEKIQGEESIEVRGESFMIPSEFFRCQECGTEFDDPQADTDVLDKAYRAYRDRHGMLQPEDIRQLRKHYDLTQKELGALLAWGEVTLSRYEKGKLQVNAHDKMLQLIKNPANMLKLIEDSEHILSPDKKLHLTEKLLDEIKDSHDFERIYDLKFGRYSPSINSGYQTLQVAKVLGAIAYFCYPHGAYQTKLNKLQYYSDTYHFKLHGKSITGLQYVKMPFGPVPKHYEFYTALLMERGILKPEEEFMYQEVQEKLISVTGPDMSIFSKEEIETLDYIKKYFSKYSAQKISDKSHQEKGYLKTQDRKIISYEYAKEVSIE